MGSITSTALALRGRARTLGLLAVGLLVVAAFVAPGAALAAESRARL